MPSKKIKISELPLVESLKGLYTIGYKIIDGIKTSVKVSLEDIQTAYQDVVNAVKNSEVATKNANTAASNANEKAVLADTAAANANDTAEHPTYIGQDHYVYKWNKIAQAYDKTDIYTKGDAFSIKKVYASVANMEADKSNPDITEGDFVLVNTGDVEDPDNAKLYVKADGDFEFLVDMSGAIGFTGKTPQFSIGTISTLEAGSTATATISEDGVDSDGNPKYKINFAIPRGNPGAPFRIAGEYATLEALKSAVPDGSAVDGFMAVGTEAPYDYYAWVNGDWVNQGKIAGAGAYIFSPTFISGAITEKDYNGLKEAIQSNMIVVCDTGVPLSMLLGAYTPIMEPTVSDSNIVFLILSTSTNGILSLYVTISAADRKISTENKTALWSDKVLAKDNTTQFIPTGDYQPATKKYVDGSKDVYVFAPKEVDRLENGVYEALLDAARKRKIILFSYEIITTIYPYTPMSYQITGDDIYLWGIYDSDIYTNYDDPDKIYVIYIKVSPSGWAEQTRYVPFTSTVLTKNNVTEYTPTEPYHPATKKYVDDKHLGNSLFITDVEKILYTASLSGVDAEQRVIDLFGSLANFRNVVTDILVNHTRYYFHTDYSFNNCVELGCVNAWRASDKTSYELHFIITYYSAGILYTNRISIVVNNSTDASRVYISNLVNSDNLTTITKKTAAEYEALGSKDANTAYCVTD